MDSNEKMWCVGLAATAHLNGRQERPKVTAAFLAPAEPEHGSRSEAARKERPFSTRCLTCATKRPMPSRARRKPSGIRAPGPNRSLPYLRTNRGSTVSVPPSRSSERNNAAFSPW